MAPIPERLDVNTESCTSTPGHGKPVNLKTAASFTVLTQTGCAVVPTMELHGNMGIAPSPLSYITGFSVKDSIDNSFATSSQVIDGVIYAADQQASPSPQAVQDALAAFYILGNQTGADYRELGSGSLNGLSLYNGLYTWSTAVDLAAGQTLYLNGGADDVFVFLSAGAFSFGGYAHVSLQGNVSAENVYWVGQTKLEGTHFQILGSLSSSTNINILPFFFY